VISTSNTPFEEIMGETFADKPTDWQTGRLAKWQTNRKIILAEAGGTREIKII